MKRLCALTLAVLALLAVGVSGAATHNVDRSTATCKGAVSWQSARRYIGHVATIRGPVASTKFAVSSNGSPTFLNIGAAYPSLRRFTVVIWIENRGRFGVPEVRYRGHTICVRGFVDEYAGVPEIEATSPTQIAVAR
jgi:hypothetical protein